MTTCLSIVVSGQGKPAHARKRYRTDSVQKEAGRIGVGARVQQVEELWVAVLVE